MAPRRLGRHTAIARIERLAALAPVMVDARGARDLPQLFFSLENRWGS